TFDKPAPSAAKNTPAVPAKAESWISSIPSEEEQMEMLKSETEADEWNTVKWSKSKKGKKASQTSAPVEEKAEEVPTAKPSQSTKPTKPVQKGKGPSTNGKPAITKN